MHTPWRWTTRLTTDVARTIVLALVLLLVTAACGSSSPPGQSSGNQSTSPTPLAPTTTPTPTASSLPGAILYQADWTSGMNGWTGGSQWKVVNGMLVSDGTNAGYTATGVDAVTAPYQPSTANYAVEASIQIVSSPDPCYFGIRGRVQSDGSNYDGYFVGFDTSSGGAVIASFSAGDYWALRGSKEYSPGSGWHTYRAAFKDNQLTLLIDGNVVLQATDNKFLSAGQVGLGNGRCQVDVNRFQVLSL